MRLILLLLFIPFFSFAWYPHKTSSEIRLIAVNNLKQWKNFSEWDISGQLLQKKISDQSQIGAMFSLGSKEKESKIGAHYTYSINKFVDIAFSGDISQNQKFGGSFWLNCNVYWDQFELKPFINIDHKTLAEVGFILYFKVAKSLFNVGLSYSPKGSLLQTGIKKEQTIAVLFGTSFDNVNNIIPEVLK